ncbi:MAG TPA: uroporphyrinogen decarboxylase family protein [Candidatus Eisenbacteria bacterium]|jgi:uroporphyrinogen decarboxylase
MTRRDRIRSTLKGGKVDRPAMSFWRHFYDREGTAAGLAGAMLDFQRAYDWDFMKVNPRASYHVEEWGVRTARSGTGPVDKPKVVHSVVREPSDWDAIRPKDPTKGALGEMLDAMERIAAEIQGETDWIMTVFNPLSIAADLVNDDALVVEHLRRHGERVHAALRSITETFTGFVRETMLRGASGIFFATTDWANGTRIDRDLMLEFGRPYDLRVLAPAAQGPLNVIHVCGPKAYLTDFFDYPVSAVSWAAHEPTNPTIADVRARTDKTLLTGIDHEGTLVTGPVEAVQAQARAAIDAAGGTRIILGPGCAVPAHAPAAHYAAAREAVLACA